MFLERSEGLYIGKFATLFRCPEIGHGVSTRPGGVSTGGCASLNLGNPHHDSGANIEANRARYFSSLGLTRDEAAIPGQVHGTRIAAVDGPGVIPDTDGVMTATPGVCLTVQTADCLPVFLYDPFTPAVALVHAGWRGCRDGILAAAVAGMRRTYGSDPAAFLACIGPAIGPCCYRVDEVFKEYFPARFFLEDRLDLAAVAVHQLTGSGIDPRRIEASGICTSCFSRYFFSYRRDGEGTGRMMSALILH
ncbi:peptidoglycan editing factor PgeF [bacterium]|nr:peptidoglycan editing factor PgeF [bacterium]